MKKISREVLNEAANKLMFKLSDEEINNLLQEFDTILKQMELLSDVPDVDNAQPMTFPFNVANSFLREDVATKPNDREELLKNAKDVSDGQVRLPKVVG